MSEKKIERAYRTVRAASVLDYPEQRTRLFARAARIVLGIREQEVLAAALRSKNCDDRLLTRISRTETYSNSDERRFLAALTLAYRSVAAKHVDSPKRRWSVLWTYVVLPLGILLTLWGVSFAIEQLYITQAQPPVLTTQNNYERKLAAFAHGETKLAYHAELGRHNKLVHVQQTYPGYAVHLSGFSIGRPWQRRISWYVEAAGNGELVVRFPKNSAARAVALFMTDGNSIWRMSTIRSGTQLRTSDRAYNGRWLMFPVREQERAAGVKRLTFQQLTGETVAVSALAVVADAAEAEDR